jgi:hypothetical protein
MILTNDVRYFIVELFFEKVDSKNDTCITYSKTVTYTLIKPFNHVNIQAWKVRLSMISAIRNHTQ